MTDKRGIETIGVRAGLASDTQHGAVIPPLYLSSNFTFAGFDEPRPYDYTRSGNPTRDTLANALAELEGGAGATITSTGMSAVILVLHLLDADDLLVAPHDCYGGTYRALSSLAAKKHFRVTFVNQTDEAALDVALAEGPKLVWVETPSNPLLRITDVRQVVAKSHAIGALVAVDNTFLSPALQRPLDLGADIVIHSTTKYLNGHSDVVGGAVIAKDQKVHEDIAWWANCLGITGAPFDSFLTLRGIRTLHARMKLHLENAQAIVELLDSHEAIAKVYHPSLPSHPGHEIAASQQKGFGAMISFELAGGTEQVAQFITTRQNFSLAESLGGVESLIAHPATMTHAAMAAEARREAGIGDTLIRISVGIENTEDLVEDLRQGLDQVAESLKLGALVAN